MRRTNFSRKMDIRETVKKYDTNNLDEFLEVNCFQCKKSNMKLTPEACLLKIIQLALLTSYERMFNLCSKCANNLTEDYSEVLRKRAEKRNHFINEIQLTDALKEFLRSNVAQLIEKYKVDEREAYSILKNYFNTLL